MQKQIKKIAIQGYEGSFHHAAALKYFGEEIQIVGCSSFQKVVEETAYNNKIEFGIMAIENSTAGSILMNYQLIEKYPVKVIGEINLRIKQNLLVNKGVTINQVKEVHSHPMAIMQCQKSLLAYPWKLVETQDTAYSAQKLKKSESKSRACIASEFAARLYGLKILQKDIHSEKYNLTRFLVLHKLKEIEIELQGQKNKSSISFWIEHKRGSLLKVLQVIKLNKINLSKIQSVPIPGSHFNYCFHADLEFDHLNQLENTLFKLKKIVTHLKIYGIYSKSKQTF